MTTFLDWLLGPRCHHDRCDLRVWPKDVADHASRYHNPIPPRTKRVAR